MLTVEYERPAALDAGFVRAHAAGRGPDAERRAASLAGNVDPHHRVAIADLILVQAEVVATDRAADARARARRRRPVGHDVSARDRVQDCAARQAPPSGHAHRRRRLRSEPRAGGLRSRARTSISWCAAKASRRSASCCARSRAAAASAVDRRACRIASRRAGGFMDPIGRSRSSDIESAAAAQPGRARARRLHAARPPGRRRRDLARLHVRLQLLLDHRDARPQLSRLSDRARAGRHRRCARPRRAGDLSGRRQHHARRPAVRDAVPGDHRARPQRHRLYRPGDDVAARAARRDAGAADAARRLPLRLPRHREHARERSRVPQGARQERAARAGDVPSATRRSRRSSICIATACSSSAA